MMRILVVLLLFSLSSNVVRAANSITAETEVAAKKWRVNLDMSHSPRVRQDQEDFSTINLIGDYFVSKKHRFRIWQPLMKVYTKYASEHEIQPFNTRLMHYYNFSEKWRGLSFIFRSDLQLPVSDLSVQDDLVTRYTGTMFINGLSFFDKRLNFSLRPFARYHWYEFKTSAGGRNLPNYTFGSSLLAILSLSDKATLIGSTVYTFDRMQASQFDANFVQREQGLYSFGLMFDYGWLDNLSTYISYDHGPASYIVDGRYDLFVFDSLTTRYSVGLAATF